MQIHEPMGDSGSIHHLYTGNAFRSLLHNLCCFYAVKVNEHDACLAHTFSVCWTYQKTLYG